MSSSESSAVRRRSFSSIEDGEGMPILFYLNFYRIMVARFNSIYNLCSSTRRFGQSIVDADSRLRCG